MTSVMIVPYRNPLLCAKMLATLDMLSKGRLIVGAGVGWMEEEFDLLDAPPFAERGAATDEYLHAFIELWTGDNPSYDGKYVQFSDIIFLPNRYRSRIRPSGSAGRAVPPCGAPPGWAMPGTRWGPSPRPHWSRRNWRTTWPTCTGTPNGQGGTRRRYR